MVGCAVLSFETCMVEMIVAWRRSIGYHRRSVTSIGLLFDQFGAKVANTEQPKKYRHRLKTLEDAGRRCENTLFTQEEL